MNYGLQNIIRVGAMAVVLGVVGGVVTFNHAIASEYPLKKPAYVDWSFSGPFGRYNKQQLQRGLKVYVEVCASCHSMSLVKFRNLGERGALGYTSEQVKAFAAEYQMEDGPDEAGDMFERSGKPYDAFPSPFPNDQAAAASNNNAVPPDFSLIAKARAVERGFPNFLIDIVTQYQEAGPDYIVALLTGYTDPPADVEVPEGTYYNPYFIAGNALSMAPPLSDELVEYDDGTPMTTHQYAEDVSAFLMWAAEPKLEERKKIGLRVMLFLIIFASMLYFVKRKIWSNIAH